ncbi:14718_t:CDS:2 [Funneliformis geosporum]|uniref:14718_t:CDS:1 n=1 Tax=Funneliformis geosporum TaxID=1117311 RepID=A0A9W4SGS9_9GLOM|nr:14718_t:CDS:2 [Funneliformis geosporum]
MNNTNDSTINIPPSIDVSSKLQKNKSSNNLIANFIPRAIFLFSVAFISLYIIIYLVQSIPNLSLPTSIEGVKLQAMILDHYSSETWQGYLHIVIVFSLIYIWKQAFSIPGAIFLNILAGALYGPLLATLMTSSLAAIGASCAYLISKFLGQPIMDQYLSDKLNYLRKQVNDNRDGLFFYLLFIRMFPLSPWWLLNLASPLLYIPLGTFFTSMFFGSISYNLACCQAGEILSELSSTNEIWQPLLLFKMILVSLISLFPPLYTRRYKRLQNNVKSTNDPSTEFLILKTEQDVV